MGPDDTYGTLWTQILNMNPIPALDHVYAMVIQEESHQNVTVNREIAPTIFHKKKLYSSKV